MSLSARPGWSGLLIPSAPSTFQLQSLVLVSSRDPQLGGWIPRPEQQAFHSSTNRVVVVVRGWKENQFDPA